MVATKGGSCLCYGVALPLPPLRQPLLDVGADAAPARSGDCVHGGAAWKGCLADQKGNGKKPPTILKARSGIPRPGDATSVPKPEGVPDLPLSSAPLEEARADLRKVSGQVMLPALEGAAGASAARAESWLGAWLRERCLACVTCKWSWLGFATVALVLLEVHMHVVCNLSPDADVEFTPDHFAVGRCATVMQLHDYTEMFCKMGLGATFARYLLAGRVIVDRKSTLPAVAYWIWPGVFVCVLGDEAGEYCALVNAVMEHGCCFAVYLAALDFLLEFAAGALREGFWGSCRETAIAARDTGPGTSPRSRRMEAARAPSRCRACLLWAAYIGTGLLYALKAWHNLDAPGLDYVFRVFDTYCHANICGAMVVWICELTDCRTTPSDVEEGVLVFAAEGFVVSSRDELCAGQ